MTEAASHADFTRIRYAQCWEDADILVKALAPEPGQVCLSIASAGDNALALLSRPGVRVVAVDLNPAQLACLELRVTAYQELNHAELLELMGSRPSTRRGALYARCRPGLSAAARRCWDSQPQNISAGIGGAGKFEAYFKIFRTRILPLVHSREKVARLLAGGAPKQREQFYANHWDTCRWRWLFRFFFSRFMMGRLGRDPAFFRYVQGNVAERILERTRYALTALNPAENPYLQWILTGTHITALPFALRPENFEAIRSGLNRLQWFHGSLEQYLEKHPDLRIHRFNLSDIFEYMSPENYQRLLGRLLTACAPGARLAYWNMLAPRSRPEALAGRLHPLQAMADSLFLEDKAWFYSRLVIEEAGA